MTFKETIKKTGSTVFSKTTAEFIWKYGVKAFAVVGLVGTALFIYGSYV